MIPKIKCTKDFMEFVERSQKRREKIKLEIENAFKKKGVPMFDKMVDKPVGKKTIKVSVGQWYKRADDSLVKCTQHDRDSGVFYVGGIQYAESGCPLNQVYNSFKDYLLIEAITEPQFDSIPQPFKVKLTAWINGTGRLVLFREGVSLEGAWLRVPELDKEVMAYPQSLFDHGAVAPQEKCSNG